MKNNLQKLFLHEIRLLLAPLVLAAQSEQGRRLLLESLGWNTVAIPNLVLDALTENLVKIADSIDSLQDFVENPPDSIIGIEKTLEIIGSIFDTIRSFQTIANQFDPGLPPQFDDLAQDIISLLVITYLENWYPILFDLAVLLTIIRPEDEIQFTDAVGDQEGDLARFPYRNHEFRSEKLMGLLRDPVSLLKEEYSVSEDVTDAGPSQQVADKLFPRVANLLLDLGVNAVYGIKSTYGFGQDINELGAGLLTIFVDSDQDESYFGLTLALSLADQGDLGLVIAPFGNFDLTQTLGSWLLELALTAGVQGFALGPQGLTLLADSDSASVSTALRIFKLPGEDGAAFLVGGSSGTRLEVAQFTISIDLNLSDEHQDYGFLLQSGSSKLVVGGGDGDGFLQAILPDEGLKIDIDLGVGWSNLRGLYFRGGAGLETDIAVRKSFGPLFVNSAYLALIARDGKITLASAATFSLNLGPVRTTVDRVGLQGIVTFPDNGGNLGPGHLRFGFRSPSGVGFAIDAGVIKGGGFFAFDPVKGEYFGALELKFANWGIKAIGVLSTKLPDGSAGFALLLLLYADLPRFHIAFNIFFEGVGGVIGLHHGVDVDAIRAGLASGNFSDILFPANPIANAPRIINRLRVIFPIRRNALVIGPMFHLTWGTKPAIGEAKMGVVLALDNALGGDGPVTYNRLVLLGRLRIGLPSVEDDGIARIICDFYGELDFSSRQFGFFARLRDSRLHGGLDLTGALVLQIDYGDRPTFLVAAGGFHPDFENTPQNIPTRIDRLGLGFRIGIVKVSVTCYLAVTSATIQFGADVQAKAKLGPVSISGWIGFDALIYYKPAFRFDLEFRVGFTIKFKGRTLQSVDVIGMLAGPGRWQISGRLKFSVLFWDIEKRFNEQWGQSPQLDVSETSVANLLRDAYNNPDNWSAALPAGADTLVTLSALPGDTSLIAPPNGQLRVSQTVAPLGLTLEKFGEGPIIGPRRFELHGVTVGDQTFENLSELDNLEMTQEYLARSTYINLSEEDRLSKPSFETFDVGVLFGTTDYEVPTNGNAVTSSALSYETKYLTPDSRFDRSGVTEPAELAETELSMAQLKSQAKSGAAASAKLRQKDRLRPAERNKIVLGKPALAIVDKNNLNSQIDLEGPAQTNSLLAEQHLADAGNASIQLIEQYELIKN